MNLLPKKSPVAIAGAILNVSAKSTLFPSPATKFKSSQHQNQQKGNQLKIHQVQQQQHDLHWLLKYFPTVSTSYVFAYGPCLITKGNTTNHNNNGTIGSSIINKTKKERVDLIFVVDEPFLWHRSNLSMNPTHYSFLKYFGPKTITKIQNNWAAGVYFNPFVTINDKLIKYGVISTSLLNNDLKDWSNVYIAGRLHKPVLELYPPSTPELVENLRKNQMYALRMTLLQLPSEFTKYDLYYGITSLSYLGNFRYIEEDPKQIRDMILPLMDQYDQIYLPLLKSLSPLVQIDKKRNLITQIDCKDTIKQLLLALPLEILLNLAAKFKYPMNSWDEITCQLINTRPIDIYTLHLKSIVRRSTLKQTFQGIFTAGLFKAIWYGVDKIEEKLTASSSYTSSSGQGALVTSSSAAGALPSEFEAAIKAGPSIKHKDQSEEASKSLGQASSSSESNPVVEELDPVSSSSTVSSTTSPRKEGLPTKTESKPSNNNN